ncbi:hypothetical protein OAM67_01495 [bacterium]|nr:hypothetical protein [bacterium]
MSNSPKTIKLMMLGSRKLMGNVHLYAKFLEAYFDRMYLLLQKQACTNLLARDIIVAHTAIQFHHPEHRRELRSKDDWLAFVTSTCDTLLVAIGSTAATLHKDKDIYTQYCNHQIGRFFKKWLTAHPVICFSAQDFGALIVEPMLLNDLFGETHKISEGLWTGDDLFKACFTHAKEFVRERIRLQKVRDLLERKPARIYC